LKPFGGGWVRFVDNIGHIDYSRDLASRFYLRNGQLLEAVAEGPTYATNSSIAAGYQEWLTVPYSGGEFQPSSDMLITQFSVQVPKNDSIDYDIMYPNKISWNNATFSQYLGRAALFEVTNYPRTPDDTIPTKLAWSFVSDERIPKSLGTVLWGVNLYVDPFDF